MKVYIQCEENGLVIYAPCNCVVSGICGNTGKKCNCKIVGTMT